MATGMKLWLGICLAGLALAAALLLPPRSAEHIRSQRDDGPLRLRPAASERFRLWGQAAAAERDLLLLRVQDSLQARLADARAEGRDRFVAFPGRLEASDHAERLRQRFADQTDSLARAGAADVLVGVLFLDGTFEGGSLSTRNDEYVFAGRLDDGAAYCARVVWVPHAPAISYSDRSWWGGPLGVCRRWLRLGPPGPHVARWLEEGGYTLVGSTDQRLSYWFRSEPMPFGIDSPVFASRGAREYVTSARACLERSEGCAELVLEPRVRDVYSGLSQVEALREVRAVTDLVAGEVVFFGSIAQPHFLAEMERLEGEDAVRRFWTSDAPVADAFREATGTEVGPWVRSWIRSLDIGLPRGRTGLGFATAGLSLVTLLAAAGVGLAFHLRREVS